MKKPLILLLTSALLLGPVVTIAAETAPKQISFGKGKTGTSVTGKIKGNESIDYQLRAGAGQTMTVDFKASKGSAYFNVLPPGSTGEAIFVGSREGNHFKGNLPSDGVYTLRLYLMGAAKDEDKTVSYTLKVNIAADGESGKTSQSGTAAAEKACLAAVAKTVGVDRGKLSVIDTSEAQSGITVNVKVPDATAPWFCLSDRKGHIQDIRFTGSEGAL